MAAWNFFIYICTRLSTLSDLLLIVAQPPPSFLCCQRPPSHRPSSLTSVSLVPVIHWLRLSISFWPYGTHPFFPHAQTISILSDLLYSLTPFLFQLFYMHLFIPNSTKLWHSNQTSQILNSSLDHSLSFSQHFSYPMPLLCTTPLVQLLLYKNASWLLAPILYCSEQFSALLKLYTPHSLCTSSLSYPPSAATCDPRYLKQFNSSNGLPFSITSQPTTFIK